MQRLQNRPNGEGFAHEISEMNDLVQGIRDPATRAQTQQVLMNMFNAAHQARVDGTLGSPATWRRLADMARDADRIAGTGRNGKEGFRTEVKEMAGLYFQTHGGETPSSGSGSGRGGYAGGGGYTNGVMNNPDVQNGILVSKWFPDQAGAHEYLASALLNAGDPAGAIAQAKQAADLDPSAGAAYATMAKAKYQLNDYPGAAEAARSALERNPGDMQALSVLKLVGGRDQPAQQPKFESLSLAKPQSDKPAALPVITPAPAPQKDKKSASAADHYQSDRLVQDAAAYRKLGNYKEAIQTADRAIQLDPDSAAALYERALAHILNKQLDAALRDIEAALKLDPSNEKLLVAHANVLNRLKLYREALQSANRALTVNPSSAEAYFNKAWALSGLKENAAALAALGRAAKLNPGYARQYREALQLPADADLAALFEGTGAESAEAVARAPREQGRGLGPLGLGASFVAGILLIAGGLFRRKSARWLEAAGFSRRRSRGAPKVGEFTTGDGTSEDVGNVVAGTFNLIRKRGEGAVGPVFEAMDRRLERKVAVKKVRPEIVGDRWEKDRLLKEARSAASLHHPNIAELYSVAEEDGEVYLVSQFVEGKTLAQVLEAGPLTLRRAREVLRGMSAALDYAHGREILHRDLKPSNVMLDAQGSVVVTDFATAWSVKDSLSRLTMRGCEGGWTLAYQGPEAGKGPGRKESDVYSLAACFYEMLTGRAPSRPLAPVSRLASGIPAELDEILARALEPDPDLRVRTAAEFCSRVEALAARPVP